MFYPAYKLALAGMLLEKVGFMKILDKLTVLGVVLTALFLGSLARAAAPLSCAERDYRGLNVEKLPPVMGEIVCQLKIVLKGRFNHDSLRRFIMLSEPRLGFGEKDLDWNLPLVGVLNGLVNKALAEGKLDALASAAQDFFARERYVLEKEELDLLAMLGKIEIQHGGRR